MSVAASERNFQQRYLKLLEELNQNPQQSEILASRGHCIALAGPGSGKTKTITAKVAKLLREEVKSPRGVACITYSAECATEITHRLSQLGIEPSSRLYLGTVHSFCFNHIARPYGAIAGFPIAEQVETEAEQQRLKDEALSIAGLPPDRKFRQAFDLHRREPLSRGPGWCKNQHLGRAIEHYERELAQRGKTDFDEMIRIAVTLVHLHPWVADVLRAKFPVLVVDEYQDLGYGLHKLVTQLQAKGVRLIAVGDPDQSIYGFNGANPGHLWDLFNKHISTNEAVRLKRNYRCSQSIIDLSVLTLGQEREFEADRIEHGIIQGIDVAGGHAAQVAYAVDMLLPTLEAAGVERGEIGFLYPNDKVCKVIAEVLTTRGIAFRGGKDVRYPRAAVTELFEVAAMWAVEGAHNPEQRLSAVLNRWRRLFQVDVTSAAGRAARKAFVGFLWHNRDPAMSLADWLSGLFELGLHEALLAASESSREQAALTGLLEAAKAGPLRGWTLQDFALMRVKGRLPHVVTIHSSKGLEYDAAIVVGLDCFYSLTPEERRKLYVALTRARKFVYLLWSGETPRVIAGLVRDGEIATISVN